MLCFTLYMRSCYAVLHTRTATFHAPTSYLDYATLPSLTGFGSKDRSLIKRCLNSIFHAILKMGAVKAPDGEACEARSQSMRPSGESLYSLKTFRRPPCTQSGWLGSTAHCSALSGWTVLRDARMRRKEKASVERTLSMTSGDSCERTRRETKTSRAARYRRLDDELAANLWLYA